MKRGIFAAMGLALLSNACASGNWIRFRAERYEAAERGERVIRASTYDTLVKAQKLAASGQQVDALDLLNDLELEVKKEPSEVALVAQAKAYVLMTMGRMHEAIPALERALRSSTLPEETQQNLRYNLVQIYVQAEQFKKAAPVLEQWIAQADAPEAQALALLGYIYYQEKRYALASEYTGRALRQEPENKEWRKILLSCEYERKHYARAREILLELIAREPTDASHWRSLIQLDLLLDKPEQALISLDLSQEVSTLDSEELLQMVRLSVHQGIPYRGAKILAQAMQSGTIPASAKHWELLAQAYLAAKDIPAAYEAFAKSAQAQKDPKKGSELCLRMAGLAMGQGAWAKARQGALCAARSEQATLRANARLIEGIASYQLRDFSSSLAALAKAQRFEPTSASAKQWAEMIEVQQMNLRAIDPKLVEKGQAR